MMGLIKKMLGREQSKAILKNKITYLILSDRKNLYK